MPVTSSDLLLDCRRLVELLTGVLHDHTGPLIESQYALSLNDILLSMRLWQQEISGHTDAHEPRSSEVRALASSLFKQAIEYAEDIESILDDQHTLSFVVSGLEDTARCISDLSLNLTAEHISTSSDPASLEVVVPQEHRSATSSTEPTYTSAGTRLRAASSKFRRRYKHKQIAPDDTRLLLIHPRLEDTDEDAIHVTLAEIPFQKLGREYPFEAVSYVWGNAHDERLPIYVHDQRNPEVPHATTPDVSSIARGLLQNQLFILPNLYNALLQFRQKTKFRVLWVDAICINQDNVREKECQVAQMNLIYQRATRTLVWLGIGGSKEAEAMNFVKDVLQSPNLNDSSVRWNTLLPLLQQSWFSRRWVVQEIALSKGAQVVCGDNRIEWDDLRDAISLFARYSENTYESSISARDKSHTGLKSTYVEATEARVLVERVNNFVRKNKSADIFEPVHGLEYLVSSLGQFETSDPRDAIFALRNIAKETSSSWSLLNSPTPPPTPPMPDYTKSLVEVYIDFVEWVFTTTQRIDLICREWAPDTGRSVTTAIALPSWIQVVPAKDSNPQYGVLVASRPSDGTSLVGLPGAEPYNASWSMPARARFIRNIPQILVEEPPPQSLDKIRTQQYEPELLWSTKKRKLSSYDSDPSPEKAKRANTKLQSLLAEPFSTSADFAMPPTPDLSEDSEASSPYSYSSETSQDEDDLMLLEDASLDKAIQVAGMRIGTINWATAPIRDGIVPAEVIRKLRKGPASQPVPDRLWRTLVAERSSDGRNPPAWYHRACQSVISHDSPDGSIDTVDILSSTVPETVKEYVRRVQAVIWNRRFFEIRPRTDDHVKLPGFGPNSGKQGDIVCILFGCTVPCVLRRLTAPGSKRSYYRFIGEAYVYGLMDGDAVASLSTEELTAVTEEFIII